MTPERTYKMTDGEKLAAYVIASAAILFALFVLVVQDMKTERHMIETDYRIVHGLLIQHQDSKRLKALIEREQMRNADMRNMIRRAHQ